MIHKLLERVRFSASGKLNSPSFAYKAVYGVEKFIPSRTDTPKKTWQGIADIDAHIKDEWLNALCKIPRIELRSTCEGHGIDHPAYIVFRLKQNQEYSQAVVDKLNTRPGIKSLTDKGMEGQSRIVVAGKVWFGEPGWEGWWNSLAGKIKTALDETLAEAEKVWFVRWANGKGVTYWMSEKAAKAFQKLHPNDASEPKLIDKPAGATVREWPDSVAETEADKKFMEAFNDFTPEVHDKIRKMSALELVQNHARLFLAWIRRGERNDDELAIKANLLLLNEINRRGSKAPMKNDLDGLSKKAQETNKSGNENTKGVRFLGIIIESKPVGNGVYEYHYGLCFNDEHIKTDNITEVENYEYFKIGESFFMSQQINRGQVVEIETGSVGYAEDKQTNTISVSVGAPRFIKVSEERTRPDTVRVVCDRARESKVLQDRTINSDRTKDVSFVESDFPVKISFGEMEYTLEKTRHGKLRLGK